MVGILALTVLVDGLLMAYWIRPPLVTVEAEITSEAHQIPSTAELQRLPTYDQLLDRWIIGNREIKDVRNHMIDPDPQRMGPDSVGSFFPLRLPDGEGLETLRRAVSQLAASGICQIALFHVLSPEQHSAAILRIQRYRNKAGLWKTCKNAFSPPPLRLD